VEYIFPFIRLIFSIATPGDTLCKARERRVQRLYRTIELFILAVKLFNDTASIGKLIVNSLERVGFAPFQGLVPRNTGRFAKIRSGCVQSIIYSVAANLNCSLFMERRRRYHHEGYNGFIRRKLCSTKLQVT
jgi:hypothetical protein